MLRLICASVILLVCAAFGAVRAESLRLRLGTADMLLSDLNSIFSSLKYEKRTAIQLAEGLANTGKLREFWKKLAASMTKGRSFGAAWEENCGMLTLDRQEAETALAFAKDFGGDSVETELSKLALALSRLDESVKNKKRDYPNKQKLAGTLSVLLGVAAALLVL